MQLDRNHDSHFTLIYFYFYSFPIGVDACPSHIDKSPHQFQFFHLVVQKFLCTLKNVALY